MKAFVYFNPGPKNDVFEGMRLRKNLKGALEAVGIPWVDSLFAIPDILHLMSPLDEAKAHDARLDGLKVVVSALYCENDYSARFLDKGKDGVYSLPPKSQRTLEAADLILVPSPAEKKLLLDCGLRNQRIETLSAGVNIARFDKSDPIELAVFSRYFRFPQTDAFAMTLGDYDDQATLDQLEIIAKGLPDMRFFFLGLPKSGYDAAIQKRNKDAPKNLRFSTLAEDDVYRSGLMTATTFLAFESSRFDPMAPLEAMAAKTQIVYVGKPIDGELLTDKKNCLAAPTAEKAIKLIGSYCAGKLPSTIIEGYRFAKANSLPEVGKRLQTYYESLLANREAAKS
jgi:hypothetical protein